MLFVYSVKWWYDSKLITSSGIIHAEDAAEATRLLDKEIYGDVEETHIYTIESGNEGYIPFHILNSFLKEHTLVDEDEDQA